MRLFTAIPFPEEIKNKVSQLMRGRLPVSYINTTNLHITLNFFGELDSDEEERVKSVFLKVAQNFKKFPIEFHEVVKFRQQVHLTLKPNNSLNELQKNLEKQFVSAGFNFQERDYYAHIKLASLHMDQVMNQGRKLENFPNQLLSELNFIADKIVLYESKLLMHHAHHTPLMEIPLYEA